MNALSREHSTPARIGAFLALMILVFSPNYGIEKYGPNPAVPAFLLFILGIWIVWRERMHLWRNSAQRRWLAVFTLIFVPVLVSIPGSFNPNHSLAIAAILLLYSFAGAALVYTLREERERIWLEKWLTIVLLFWIADSGVQLLFGRDLFGVAIGPENRILGPFAGNMRAPVLILLFMPVMLEWFLARNAPAAVAVLLAGGAIAVMSGARTMLLWVGIIAVGLFIRLPAHRLKWLMLAAIPLVSVLAVSFSPSLQERLARAVELENPSFEAIDHFLSGRLTLWHTATNMVKAHPITGVGAGAFHAAYLSHTTLKDDIFVVTQSKPNHSHQLYVGIAAETGLIGLLGLVVLVGLCLAWLRAGTPAQRARAWPYALGLLVYAFPISTQPPLFLPWLFPVLVLLMAGLLAGLDAPAGVTEKPVS